MTAITKGANISRLNSAVGGSIINRAVTAELFVSPNGDDTDGLSWATAYTTIQGALAVASTDADDCTLILIAPHATFYDINTTGDPTYTGNYIFKGSHRLWAVVKNTHASATSVMKFTGKASLIDLAIFTDSTNNANGVIFTNSGFRVSHCGFNSEGTDAANTSIHIDGATTLRGGRIDNIQVEGNIAYTTGLLNDNAKINNYSDSGIHNCLVGVHIVDAGSDYNDFNNVEVGECAKAFKIDAGNEQHFNNITLHHNTVNFDDAVGDSIFNKINGEFEIDIEPMDLSGVEITAGNGSYGSDTEIRAAATATKPFKVIGFTAQPSSDENTLIRFSADGGTTFFKEQIFSSKKNKAIGSGNATDFIFNVGTRISASVWSPDAGRTVDVWLEIQEI